MNEIKIHEVGLRDGLQIEKQAVPLEKKIEWVEGLLASGIELIQLGSFVNPEKVPQMADTDKLFAHFTQEQNKPAGTIFSGLVLNEKGMERGMSCGVELFCMGVSASDTHSRKNTGKSTEEATVQILAMAQAAMKAKKRIQVSIQSAFGCGFEGEIPQERIFSIVDRYLEAGILNISLADTAGHAYPGQVERLFAAILKLDPDAGCTGHFHNTYGLGMANIMAALRVGVTSFETSFAGLGGCPFTKVAAGNVATEDFVNALQLQGMRHDIDLGSLVGVAADVARYFEREMPGCVYKTGSIRNWGSA